MKEEEHVSRRELKLELDALASKLQTRTLLMVAGAVGVLKFDVPTEASVSAVGIAVAVALGKSAFGRF